MCHIGRGFQAVSQRVSTWAQEIRRQERHMMIVDYLVLHAVDTTTGRGTFVYLFLTDLPDIYMYVVHM